MSRVAAGERERPLPLYVAGLFQDRGLARRVVTALLQAGVRSSEISLVARESAQEDVSQREAVSVASVANGENYFADLAVHSAWERLGWQGGARPAYRDKFPPKIEMAFLAAGPIAIAIGGAQLGAAAGGLVGAMHNFGFPLDRNREWYDEITHGRAWVMVRTSEREAASVRSVFERFNPDLPAESVRHW